MSFSGETTFCNSIDEPCTVRLQKDGKIFYDWATPGAWSSIYINGKDWIRYGNDLGHEMLHVGEIPFVIKSAWYGIKRSDYGDILSSRDLPDFKPETRFIKVNSDHQTENYLRKTIDDLLTKSNDDILHRG